jgi:general secretion pathway protein B
MSLILDALNRSKQDADEVPGLATRHYEPAPPDTTAPWRKWLPWLALGVALAIIAWLLLERGEEQPGAMQGGAPAASIAREPVPSSQEKPLEAAPAAQQKPAPTVTPTTVAPTVTAPSSPAAPEPVREVATADLVNAAPEPAAAPAVESDAAVADLYQRREAAEPDPTPAAQEQAPPEAPRPAVEPAAPEPAAPEPAAPEPAGKTLEEQPVDIESIVSRAENELENARLAEHPAPFIAQLSQQTKDGIPSIFYQRHDYRGDSGQSVVVLNGQELRVGGRPAAGVTVDEILPDSVVLSYRGTQFRLRALNSWVNL